VHADLSCNPFSKGFALHDKILLPRKLWGFGKKKNFATEENVSKCRMAIASRKTRALFSGHWTLVILPAPIIIRANPRLL